MENTEQNASASTSEAPNVEPKQESSVTVAEFLEDLQTMEETAEALFATQDPSNCTFPEGYKPRQTVFTCLTCTPPPQMAGVCYGCSLNCHDGHDMVELYTKRKFCCDCGNPKFGDKKCTLYEEKPKENEFNKYNHNYHGKFCSCDVFYPDDDKESDLYQCEICEDWFHEEHSPSIQIRYETEASAATIEEEHYGSTICATCIRKIPFVAQITEGKDVFCHSKLTPEQLAIPESLSGKQSLRISNFRKRLCKCADCIRVYEMADCEFLTDNEDDITTFEIESKKAAEKEKKSDADEMRELVKEYGMDGARVVYEGMEHFKRKFTEFVEQASQSGKEMITAEDAKKFAEDLRKDRKRPRFE